LPVGPQEDETIDPDEVEVPTATFNTAA